MKSILSSILFILSILSKIEACHLRKSVCGEAFKKNEICFPFRTAKKQKKTNLSKIYAIIFYLALDIPCLPKVDRVSRWQRYTLFTKKNISKKKKPTFVQKSLCLTTSIFGEKRFFLLILAIFVATCKPTHDKIPVFFSPAQLSFCANR